jgi:hypothetical protein
MVVRLKRQQDCKLEVEKSLSKLGYKNSPRLQEAMANKECVVTFTDVPIDIYTNESYAVDVELCIELNIDNNNEFPYTILEIIENVTRDVEASGAPWCTGFRFTKPTYSTLGETINVHLYAIYPMELDWIDNNN